MAMQVFHCFMELSVKEAGSEGLEHLTEVSPRIPVPSSFRSCVNILCLRDGFPVSVLPPRCAVRQWHMTDRSRLALQVRDSASFCSFPLIVRLCQPQGCFWYWHFMWFLLLFVFSFYFPICVKSIAPHWVVFLYCFLGTQQNVPVDMVQLCHSWRLSPFFFSQLSSSYVAIHCPGFYHVCPFHKTSLEHLGPGVIALMIDPVTHYKVSECDLLAQICLNLPCHHQCQMHECQLSKTIFVLRQFSDSLLTVVCLHVLVLSYIIGDITESSSGLLLSALEIN